MEIDVSRKDLVAATGDAVVIPLTKSDAPPRALAALDEAIGGLCARVWAAGDFTGKSGEVLSLPVAGIAAKRVVLIGLGDERSASRESLRAVGGRAAKTLARAKAAKASLAVPALRRVAAELAGQALAEGLVLGAYRFDKYKTGNDAPTALERVTLLAPDARQVPALRRGAKLGQTVAEAANFARDLSNEPGSVCTPEYLADQARKLGRSLKLKVTVYDEKELAREKMNGILAVGRGSVHPPRLIVLEYGAEPKSKAKSRARKRPTLAFVGKGITFDTGGISIKPAASMDEMKHDMCGGAAVLGALRAVAELGLPLPRGRHRRRRRRTCPTATRTCPATSSPARERQDDRGAEHRRRGPPRALRRAAPRHRATSRTRSSTWRRSRARAWWRWARSPARFWAATRSSPTSCARPATRPTSASGRCRSGRSTRTPIKGTFGDILNTGGRNGGAITAAAFLSHFVGETPWAHLDIAGTAWTTKELPYYVKGATGFGVRLLIEMLRAWK